MKTNPSLQHPVVASLAGAALFSLGQTHLPAQDVVIEGGPGKIQISDEDNQREAVTPGAVLTDPAPVPAPAPSSPERMRVEPIPGSDVIVNAPLSGDQTASPVEKAEPGGEPELDELNVTRMKKLSAYARELGIAETATLAQITWDADELYVRETSEVAEAIHPTLEDFAEYLKLSDWEEVTLQYFHDSDLRDAAAARERSLAFANYLSEKLKVETIDFVIEDPVAIDKEIPADAGVLDAADLSEPVLKITMR